LVDQEEALSVKSLLNYYLRGKGVLTRTGLEGTAFVRTRPGLELPDLQLHFVSGLGSSRDSYVLILFLVSTIV
jgi:hypothetical protein